MFKSMQPPVIILVLQPSKQERENPYFQTLVAFEADGGEYQEIEVDT